MLAGQGAAVCGNCSAVGVRLVGVSVRAVSADPCHDVSGALAELGSSDLAGMCNEATVPSVTGGAANGRMAASLSLVPSLSAHGTASLVA